MIEKINFADGPLAGKCIALASATPTLEGGFAGRYELANVVMPFNNDPNVYWFQEYRYNAAFCRGSAPELAE